MVDDVTHPDRATLAAIRDGHLDETARHAPGETDAEFIARAHCRLAAEKEIDASPSLEESRQILALKASDYAFVGDRRTAAAIDSVLDELRRASPDAVSSEPATCATCRHWNSNDSRAGADEPDKSYGVCEQTVGSGGLPDYGEIPSHPAFARDAEQYGAVLRTLPTFSCNQHAAVTL